MNIPLQNLDWPEIVDDAEDELYVADLGCGEAAYHQELESAVYSMAGEQGFDGDVEIYGVEADREKVETARNNNPGEGFQYIHMELGEDNLDDESMPGEGDFDVVISQHLMCETDNPGAVSMAADRLAKDSGYNQVHTTC